MLDATTTNRFWNSTIAAKKRSSCSRSRSTACALLRPSSARWRMRIRLDPTIAISIALTSAYPATLTRRRMMAQGMSSPVSTPPSWSRIEESCGDEIAIVAVTSKRCSRSAYVDHGDEGRAWQGDTTRPLLPSRVPPRGGEGLLRSRRRGLFEQVPRARKCRARSGTRPDINRSSAGQASGINGIRRQPYRLTRSLADMRG